MVCANAGYLLSTHPLVCYGAEYFSVLKRQVPNDFYMTTEDMRTTPHKAMGVGSLTTIHRANKCEPQVVRFLQCIQKTVRKEPNC